MKANLTLRGMYEYDNSIFDDMTLPPSGTVTATDGTVINYPAVDAELLINNLFMQSMSFSIIHANPNVLKYAIGVWSKTNLTRWTRLYETEYYKYNPLENYDRIETGKDVTDRDLTFDKTLDHNGNSNGRTENSGDAEDKVSAFNVSSYSPNNQSSNSSTSESVNNSTAHDTEHEKHGGKETLNHDLRAHGNIGVTSSQDMIRQEREVSEFSIYKTITDEFICQFCITLY